MPANGWGNGRWGAKQRAQGGEESARGQKWIYGLSVDAWMQDAANIFHVYPPMRQELVIAITTARSYWPHAPPLRLATNMCRSKTHFDSSSWPTTLSWRRPPDLFLLSSRSSFFQADECTSRPLEKQPCVMGSHPAPADAPLVPSIATSRRQSDRCPLTSRRQTATGHRRTRPRHPGVCSRAWP